MPSDQSTLSIFILRRPELISYAAKIVDDRAHAEDVVQEAYLRFEAASRERRIDDPLAYLYRIVRNLSLDQRRRLGRERRRTASDTEAAVDQLEQDSPSPEATVSARQDMKVMAEAMAELPERTRIAFEMHRLGDCTFKEIAAHLDVSVGTAHALVVQALEHCRQRLFRNKG